MAKRKSIYRQFCPVARAAEVLAERWTLLVVRELLSGSRRFSEIQRGVAAMSPSLLSKRLDQLERAKVIRKVPQESGRGFEYELTRAGEELRPVVEGLGAWGQRWAGGELDPDELDPQLLMWDIRRRMDPAGLPAGRPSGGGGERVVVDDPR